MSIAEAGLDALDRAYRDTMSAIPVREERVINVLKRGIPIAWYGTMVGVVLVIMVIISFQTTTDTDVFVTTYTLANYARLLQQTQYLQVFFNTVFIAAGAGLFAVVFSYPSSYYIGVKLPERYQYPMVLGIIVPMWTLFIIRVYAWMTILGTNGTVHKLLLFFGLVGQDFTLLYTRFSVIVVLAQIWFPMAFLPIYSAMAGIDEEIFEAARDLGGSRWDIFREIVFPLTLPSAFGGFLLVFLPALGSYVIPLLVGGKQGIMIAQFIASQFLSAYNWPFGAALAVVLAIIVLVLIAVLQRVISFREALGGFA
ncbi:MAG: ABC transporter permease [Halodesulfurarchaeum sp.]